MRSEMDTKVKGKKILLIDDDAEFSDDLAFLLDGPYRFVSVAESRKGIERLEKEKFDLVILDLKMPSHFADEDEREGIEVLQIIRNRWGVEREKRIPVIVLTRMDTDETRTKCLELNADSFFKKPPEIDVLKWKIQDLLKDK